ncbi:MAG: MXAN_5187 C-terminal domain-containing protein [Acidobacteriota bacterium]
MTVEEDIRRIDVDITKLKIQFDLYFAGSVPRPPTSQRDALEKQVKQLQFSIKSVADRFLYNAVLNKFNAYSELWLKNLRIKEEGVHLHPLARRAAHRAAAAAGVTGGSNGSAAVGAAKAHGPHPDSWRISTTRNDEKVLRNLYENFIAAKDQVGDQKKPSFDAFAREIARHTATIKDKVDCELIDFKIYSGENKVSIKAKPLK